MSKRATVIPLIVLVVAALLFFVINGGWTSWFGGRAKQETDDAYVQADMTPLSTHISGTVRKMKVEDKLRRTGERAGGRSVGEPRGAARRKTIGPDAKHAGPRSDF